MTTEKAHEIWMKKKPIKQGGRQSGKDFWCAIERCILTTLQLEADKPEGKHTVLTTMENIQEHYDDLAKFERNKVIDEVISNINMPYGSFCVAWDSRMSKEQIAQSVLKQAKEQFIYILEQMKKRRIQHKGYEVTQASNNHLWITKDGKTVMHSQCNKPLSEDGLKEAVDDYIEFMELMKEGV